MNDRDFEQAMTAHAEAMRAPSMEQIVAAIPMNAPVPTRPLRLGYITLPWGQVILALVDDSRTHDINDYFR